MGTSPRSHGVVELESIAFVHVDISIVDFRSCRMHLLGIVLSWAWSRLYLVVALALNLVCGSSFSH